MRASQNLIVIALSISQTGPKVFVALQSLTAQILVKGFNRVEYRVRPSGPVVQPGMLTSQVSGRRTSGLQTRIWSRDRKVAGSNPARSTKKPLRGGRPFSVAMDEGKRRPCCFLCRKRSTPRAVLLETRPRSTSVSLYSLRGLRRARLGPQFSPPLSSRVHLHRLDLPHLMWQL